jgi:hypothetical protein
MELGPNFTPAINVVANLAIALGADCLVQVIEFLGCPDRQDLCEYVVKMTAINGVCGGN